MRRRKGHRQPVDTRTPPPEPAQPFRPEAFDFVHDQFVTGRWLPAIHIDHDVTREYLETVAETSISGKRDARTSIAQRVKQGMVASDDGTAPTSKAVLAWCGTARPGGSIPAPGKPIQNAALARFNGRIRDGLPLVTSGNAPGKIAAWTNGYNPERPYSSLKYLTPAAFVRYRTQKQWTASRRSTEGYRYKAAYFTRVPAQK